MKTPEMIIELDPVVLKDARTLRRVNSFSELTDLIQDNEIPVGSYWRDSNQQVSKNASGGDGLPDGMIVAYLSSDNVYAVMAAQYSLRSYHAVDQGLAESINPAIRSAPAVKKGPRQKQAGPDKNYKPAGYPPTGITWSEVESEVELFEPASNLIRMAGGHAERAKPARALSSGVLFFGISDRGRTEGETRWAADFLIRELQRNGTSRYHDVRTRFLTGLSIQPHLEPRPIDAPILTEALFATLKVAAELADRTTGQSRVHTRHLLAALLLEEGEVFSVIDQLGLEPALLRDRMLGFMLGWGDDDAEWERILTPTAPGLQRLVTYHADDAKGSDLIGIGREVVAMATLITARDVRPPLSIGLFGEWGSGKTFFMRQLRTAIATLSSEARKCPKMQREIPFYKRVVQIEFNAWHYVEGNLWASLVEHIFRNLRIEEDEAETVTQSLQKNLLAKIGFQKAALDLATAEEQQAKAAVKQAEQELQEAEDRRELKRQELSSLKARNIKRQFDMPAIQQELQPLLAALGIDKVGTAATDLLHAMKRAETVLQQGGGVLTPLIHAPDRNIRWARLAGAVLVPSAIGLIAAWLLRTVNFAPVAAAMGTLATLGGTVTAWVRRQTEWVDTKMQKVQAIQRSYDDELATLLQENDEQITQLQQQLRDLNADRDRKLDKQADAQKALQAVQDELKSATSVRLLADFIVDRAESTDYRKHLGVLALVRDDFEKLSGLIDDENWKLAPAIPGERDRPGIEKFETIEEESKDQDNRINRIVLYIDDLDRCPPNKVVEVLQAVHLLLAFPLFVVVVGVDARWVKRSLRTRYRELLHTEEREEETEELEMIGAATADDYLEKIFQVPFWLEPMDVNGCRRMVSGLLRASLKQDAAPKSPPAQPGQPAASPNSQNSLSVQNAQKDGSTKLPGGSPQAASTEPSAENGFTPPEEGPPQVNIESLEIRPEEIQFMSELAPVLGRSPRALKRFTNVYRLVKAGLSPAEYGYFLSPDFGPYQIVLLLLAIDTGTPYALANVYTALAQQREQPATGNADWLINALELGGISEQGSRYDSERLRLRDWIAERRTAPYLGNADHIARWAERIARYSFGAEALELLRNSAPLTEASSV
ncbi:MAG: P-loop NTPase fold protein [Gemmatimonadota bacterium]